MNLEKCPYEHSNLPVEYRRRDFVSVGKIFEWWLGEHCPECQERRAIHGLIQEAVERACNLTILYKGEEKTII